MVIVMGQEQLMRRLESEANDPYRWSNGPGHRYAEHVHPYEKVLYCEAGSISFQLVDKGRQVDLGAGDRLRRSFPH